MNEETYASLRLLALIVYLFFELVNNIDYIYAFVKTKQ